MSKKLLIIIPVFFSSMHLLLAQSEEVQDTTQGTIVKMYQDIEVFKRLKLSGYIQSQFQYADSSGQNSFNGGNFPSGTDKRFSVRRGRLKVQYDAVANERGISTSQYVLQFDVTEKGLAIKDAYVKITDPWIGWFALTSGMQNRPFGYEITYTSNWRESPERGRMSQIIFPGERDAGAMLTFQGPKSTRWNWLKLDAGVFNGTGARGPGLDASDFDKYKDFIGRVGMTKSTISENIKYALGFSYYYGGFRHDQSDTYKYGTDSNGVKGFVLDIKKADVPTNVSARQSIKRNYIGVDAQISIDWAPGITTLRGEYIQGIQPGTSGSTTSAAAPFLNTNTYVVIDTSGIAQTVTTTSTFASDLYSRNFNGGYFYFLQNILQTPVQLIVKYDWYDPNTKVKGDEIGKKMSGKNYKTTNASDIKFNTWGFGLTYHWDANVKFTAYYEVVKNETSQYLSNYMSDIKDNLFTLRLQIKF